MFLTTGSPSRRPSASLGCCESEALLIWPRLSRRALARCGGDTARIAAYVAHRTCLSTDVIIAMLEERMRLSQEASNYFG
jgi:hypothetical protein